MSYEIGKAERKTAIDTVRLGQFSISLLIFYYMWYNEKFGHNALIVYGAFLVMCGSLAITMAKDRELSYDKFYFGIWWNFVFIVYAFITGIFVSYDISSLMEGIRLVLQYSLIAFSIYYFAVKSENGIHWLLMTINAASLLCCFYLIIDPVEKIRGRFSISIRNNPNTLGFMLVIGLFSIAYRFRAEIKWLILYAPQILLMLYGIVRTGSRKALMATVVLMVIWGYVAIMDIRNTAHNWKQLAIVIAFVAVIIVGVRFVMSAYSQSAVSLRMEYFFEDDSNRNRISNYKLAWKIFLEKPIFGGGFDQFKHWSDTGGYSHSTYAEAIANFGIVGCLIYFLPIFCAGYTLFRKAISRENHYKARMAFALWCVEIFMGLGQIFFVDIMHFIAWTIIYINAVDRKEMPSNFNKYRFIKN